MDQLSTIQQLLAAAGEIADFLEEAHQDDLTHDHYGDDPTTCSYCRAIRNVRALEAEQAAA